MSKPSQPTTLKLSKSTNELSCHADHLDSMTHCQHIPCQRRDGSWKFAWQFDLLIYPPSHPKNRPQYYYNNNSKWNAV